MGLGFLGKLFEALIPKLNPKILPPKGQETTQLEEVQAIAFSTTEPLDIPIVYGIKLRKRDLKGRLGFEIKRTFKVLLSTEKMHSILITFHDEKGVHFDFRLYRPYMVRKDKGGCITHIELTKKDAE